MRPSRSWQIKEGIDTGPAFYAVLWVGLLLFVPDRVHPKDLGQVGDVYPIVEESTPKHTRQRTNNNKQPAHAGLPLTTAHEEHYLDLSYTVPRDITDQKGKILYPKGYRFNPLEHRRFRTMVIIDGTDNRQLDWAKALERVDDPMIRIVITKGNTAKVSKCFKRRVYRLHPQVAERYRITSVPTIIQQKGTALAVTAIPVD